MGTDLGADHITSVVDLHITTLFAIQFQAWIAHIELCQVFSLRLLLLWSLHACKLPFLEKDEGRLVGLIVTSRVWTLELHESAVGVAVDVAFALEVGDFHLVRVDESVDLAPNLVTILINTDLSFLFTR